MTKKEVSSELKEIRKDLGSYYEKRCKVYLMTKEVMEKRLSIIDDLIDDLKEPVEEQPENQLGLEFNKCK